MTDQTPTLADAIKLVASLTSGPMRPHLAAALDCVIGAAKQKDVAYERMVMALDDLKEVQAQLAQVQAEVNRFAGKAILAEGSERSALRESAVLRERNRALEEALDKIERRHRPLELETEMGRRPYLDAAGRQWCDACNRPKPCPEGDFIRSERARATSTPEGSTTAANLHGLEVEAELRAAHHVDDAFGTSELLDALAVAEAKLHEVEVELHNWRNGRQLGGVMEDLRDAKAQCADVQDERDTALRVLNRMDVVGNSLRHYASFSSNATRTIAEWDKVHSEWAVLQPPVDPSTASTPKLIQGSCASTPAPEPEKR